MVKMSMQEAGSFLEKFVHETTPLAGFLVSATGVRAQLKGVLDSATVAAGLVVSTSSPASGETGYINVPLDGRTFECTYGEKRELPEPMRRFLTATKEESVILFAFEDGDRFALYFTV